MTCTRLHMQPTTKESVPHIALLAGCILFLAVGSRQGFGLFMQPTMDSGVVSREQFSLVVATQYLVWGLTAPLAGLLADRRDSRGLLIAGAAFYFVGFVGAAAAQSALLLWLSAGLFMGCGLGAASFGVVHALVTRATPPDRAGAQLGRVAAITALGQLLLLFFSEAAINWRGWRAAFLCHSVLVLGIAIAALLLPKAATRPPRGGPAALGSGLQDVFSTGKFWLVAVAFGFSGFQVMATMTHLPAMTSDWQHSGGVAIAGLTALSATAFLGNWLVGRWADRYSPRRMLVAVYSLRAVLSVLLVLCTDNAWAIVALCALLGLLWMSPISLSSQLSGQLFGTRRLASVFSVMFLMHQIGGFAGTWLAGVLRESTGSYKPLWWVFAILTCLGALSCLRLTPTTEVHHG